MFEDLSGDQLPITFKRLIGLKMGLVKFTYFEGLCWVFPSLSHNSLLVNNDISCFLPKLGVKYLLDRYRLKYGDSFPPTSE